MQLNPHRRVKEFSGRSFYDGLSWKAPALLLLLLHSFNPCLFNCTNNQPGRKFSHRLRANLLIAERKTLLRVKSCAEMCNRLQDARCSFGTWLLLLWLSSKFFLFRFQDENSVGRSFDRSSFFARRSQKRLCKYYLSTIN